MTARSDVTLEDIASELYALPPKEFIAARDAMAKQLDDGALAAEVRALRKPLLAAWVVNLFAREHTAALGQALDLARELREAQDDMDARALTALNRQRRTLVRALAQQAGALAGERGETVSQATTDAVEQTLNAAMFHADAAIAVASGRLIRPLDASGVDAEDLADAVAGHLEMTPVPTSERPADEVAARRERKAAAAEARAADAALAQAERALDEAERRWVAAQERAGRLRDRAEHLEAEWEAVRKDVERLRGANDALNAERLEARDRVEEARRAAEATRTALEEWTS